MKSAAILSSFAAAASALSILRDGQAPLKQPTINIPDESADAATESFLIELAPGETRWITEDEKWELRRVSPPL